MVILLNQLINPTTVISDGAHDVNGLSFDELTDKPSYSSLHSSILNVIKDKIVCIYGVRVFRQTSDINGLESPLNYSEDIFCVLKNYSELIGEYTVGWNKRKYKEYLTYSLIFKTPKNMICNMNFPAYVIIS